MSLGLADSIFLPPVAALYAWWTSPPREPALRSQLRDVPQECGEVALVLIGGRGSRPDHLSSGFVAARSLAELLGVVEVLELHPNNGACMGLCVRLGSELRCTVSEVRVLCKGQSESV